MAEASVRTGEESTVHTASAPWQDTRTAGDLRYISDTVQVTASVLSNGAQALIGTDTPKKCILTFNGADGCFTLAW